MTILTDDQKTKVQDWVYTFSGDSEVRSNISGLVWLACDGYFGQEEYHVDLGVFSDPTSIVEEIQRIWKTYPCYAVKPRSIVIEECAKLGVDISKLS